MQNSAREQWMEHPQDMTTLAPEQLVALLAEPVQDFTSGEAPLASVAVSQLTARGKVAMAALLTGLAHPDRKVRATCALLLDHVADDSCIAPLLQAMRHDPYEAVRRCAMHSLVCDGCKDCALNTDVVGALIESALTDRSKQVRRRAVFYLSQQRPDPRATDALQTLLTRETDPVLLRRARRVLDWFQTDSPEGCLRYAFMKRGFAARECALGGHTT